MNSATLNRLSRLRDKFRPRFFGKAAQKLLALALCESGHRVAEHSVQGVDVETQGQGGRYAIEVKTTRGQQVRLDEGNIRSLRDRLGDDYVPSVAILRLVPLENWLVASIPLRELAVGTYPVERFRASRIPELEAAINDHFDTIVARNFAGIQRQGLSFLDDLLRRAGAEVEDTPQCESPIRTQD